MNVRPISGYSAQQLIDGLAQARHQLHALMACLQDANWLGPCAGHLNPPLWEVGHIIWFQERWCVRALPDGRFADSLLVDADALYDSSSVAHDSRWILPLLPLAGLDDYARQVSAIVTARLQNSFNPELAYFAELCLYHELMHIEAWWMAFQNQGLAPPAHTAARDSLASPGDRLAFGESEVALGSGTDEGFIFDNEKWRHTVAVPAFDIDAGPLSERAFADFVDAGGYEDTTGWSDAGRAWRRGSGATHPLYWRREGTGWQVRHFTDWSPPNPDQPMLHVNRFEAEACAAWLGRRLPSAGQWLRATALADFHWGACWEWLRDPFAPYPGFSPDPYRDYSQPWFHTHGELRGGGPFTHPLLRRPGYRNFYLPHRRDPFAGFRTASPGI